MLSNVEESGAGGTNNLDEFIFDSNDVMMILESSKRKKRNYISYPTFLNECSTNTLIAWDLWYNLVLAIMYRLKNIEPEPDNCPIEELPLLTFCHEKGLLSFVIRTWAAKKIGLAKEIMLFDMSNNSLTDVYVKIIQKIDADVNQKNNAKKREKGKKKKKVNLLQKARIFGRKKFPTGLRSINKKSLFFHCSEVAEILSEYGCEEKIVTAGFLHNALKRIPEFYYPDLFNLFGREIADIVRAVTEDYVLESDQNNKTYRERKKKYLENLAHESESVMLVLAADKISNLRSLLKNDSLQLEEGKHWFYSECLKILKDKLKNPIVLEIEDLCLQVKKKFNMQV